MSKDKTTSGAPSRFWALATAMAMASAATGADASVARVVIDSFTASGTSTSGFLFAPTDNRFQSWLLQAETNGGATTSSNSNTVFTWSNQTATAQTATAKATVASTNQTDPSGALETPNFTLEANATPLSNGLIQDAFGNMLESGLFCFGNGNNFDGTTAGCNAAGSVTFTVFYDLIISALPGGPASSAYAEFDVTGTGVPNGLFFDIASTAAGGSSKLTQEFTWTANLLAGGFASVDLNGVVVVQAVPEPNVLVLAALGLIGLAATRRRNSRAVSAVS